MYQRSLSLEPRSSRRGSRATPTGTGSSSFSGPSGSPSHFPPSTTSSQALWYMLSQLVTTVNISSWSGLITRRLSVGKNRIWMESVVSMTQSWHVKSKCFYSNVLTKPFKMNVVVQNNANDQNLWLHHRTIQSPNIYEMFIYFYWIKEGFPCFGNVLEINSRLVSQIRKARRVYESLVRLSGQFDWSIFSMDYRTVKLTWWSEAQTTQMWSPQIVFIVLYIRV